MVVTVMAMGVVVVVRERGDGGKTRVMVIVVWWNMVAAVIYKRMEVIIGAGMVVAVFVAVVMVAISR